MYESVAEYFATEWTGHNLVSMLNNTGAFWPCIRDNTIPHTELEQTIRVNATLGRGESAVFQASIALFIGRLSGKLPTPK